MRPFASIATPVPSLPELTGSDPPPPLLVCWLCFSDWAVAQLPRRDYVFVHMGIQNTSITVHAGDIAQVRAPAQGGETLQRNPFTGHVCLLLARNHFVNVASSCQCL